MEATTKNYPSLASSLKYNEKTGKNQKRRNDNGINKS